MASDWDKVLAGGALDSQSEEIANDRIRGQALLARLNGSSAGDAPLRQQICRELFGHCPDSCWISTPFTCEFGRNIHIGEKTFFNFNVTILDVGEPCAAGPQRADLHRHPHHELSGTTQLDCLQQASADR